MDLLMDLVDLSSSNTTATSPAPVTPVMNMANNISSLLDLGSSPMPAAMMHPTNSMNLLDDILGNSAPAPPTNGVGPMLINNMTPG